MNLFSLSADKLAQVEQRMRALGVRESDLEETFVRSGGAGGQKVNKSSSCVMVLHRPTGLRVKCQTTRHQAMNRLLARRLLLEKIERMQKAYAEAERGRLEKLRRQKRKRSPLAKERMLADKQRQSQKKRLRGPLTPDSRSSRLGLRNQSVSPDSHLLPGPGFFPTRRLADEMRLALASAGVVTTWAGRPNKPNYPFDPAACC